MLILLDGKTPEAALIQVAANLVVIMLAIAFDVGVADPRQRSRERSPSAWGQSTRCQ
jgi:hypothetical protein